jgi:hypothetical protein
MLGYVSVLNLMSDWTCYSVAPIAMMTVNKYREDIDPEELVTLLFLANTVASTLEPAILGWLGLRCTILFGASLLMAGSIVKSGELQSAFAGGGVAAGAGGATVQGAGGCTWAFSLWGSPSLSTSAHPPSCWCLGSPRASAPWPPASR